MHPGRGYPAKIVNKKAFLIDFLPIERRTLQRQGFVLDHIAYYSNAIVPLMFDRKKYGQFVIRRDPRDLSRIYVLDPIGKFYIEVPYRTLYRPTISLWEHRAAIKKLNTTGIKQIDEAKIFEAVDMLRGIAKDAAQKSKKARRDTERANKLKLGSAINLGSGTESQDNVDQEPNTEIKPFADIEVWRNEDDD